MFFVVSIVICQPNIPLEFSLVFETRRLSSLAMSQKADFLNSISWHDRFLITLAVTKISIIYFLPLRFSLGGLWTFFVRMHELNYRNFRHAMDIDGPKFSVDITINTQQTESTFSWPWITCIIFNLHPECIGYAVSWLFLDSRGSL